MPLSIDCDALLFDMDGTLVDSTSAIESNWRRWAARHDIDPQKILAICHGRKTSDILREIAPHVDIRQETAWLDEQEHHMRDGILPVPGAPELIAQLPADQWAVVTSASPELATLRLQTAGLPIPAVLISGRDVPRGKPHPDGYLLAATRLKALPAHCLVIEDTPAGLAAGRAAGMQLLGLTTTHPAAALLGVPCIPNFTRTRIESDSQTPEESFSQSLNDLPKTRLRLIVD